MVVTPETFYTNHLGQQNPINTPQNSCTPVSFATEAVYTRNLSTKTCTFMTEKHDWNMTEIVLGHDYTTWPGHDRDVTAT